MGTKTNPGRFDCYAAAAPDEPLFILLARDPAAPGLIKQWAAMRRVSGGNPEKVAEALECARQMEVWRIAHAPDE